MSLEKAIEAATEALPCIEGAGSRGGGGYRRVMFEGRRQAAHRVAWIRTHGPIPEDMLVCHHCDNPPCIRLEHLFLGTQSDNLNDAKAKGRHRYVLPQQPTEAQRARGEDNGRARLTAIQVKEIKSRPESSRVLAQIYGVHPTTIQRVRNGKRWN